MNTIPNDFILPLEKLSRETLVAAVLFLRKVLKDSHKKWLEDHDRHRDDIDSIEMKIGGYVDQIEMLRETIAEQRAEIQRLRGSGAS